MSTKILLIENDAQQANNTRTLLEFNDYEVIVADDGFKGLDIVKQNPPDLIVCEVTLPGMDGYQVLTELNKDTRTSLIPFIFFTAQIGYKDFRKGMELGADDYFFKSYNTKEFLASIKTRLKKARG